MVSIALINPPSPFLIDERVFPNMGLVRVATQLKSEGYDVDLHDFAGRNLELHDFDKYDLIGFSSTSPQMPDTMKLLDLVKQVNPNARTVIGGPHATALYHLRESGIVDPNIEDLKKFDTIFAGEGESTENMFKLGWQKGKLIKDLDSTPIPDRSFIGMGSYHFDLMGKKATSIQTQRGCPGACTFCCGRDMEMYNKVRTHSPSRVIQELDDINEKYGIDSFMWYDDEVNVNTARLEELCDRLSKRDYKHRGFVRSDYITRHPESVDWLRKAGFVKLCSGVESGSDNVLRRIKKGVTVEQNYEALRLIGEAGIHYEAFIIIGHPDETRDDVRQTIDWLKRAQPDDFDINVLTVYPGSKLYNDAKPSIEYPGYNWEADGLYFNKPVYSKDPSFYKGINAQSASHTRTDNLTEADIHKMRDAIQKK